MSSDAVAANVKSDFLLYSCAMCSVLLSDTGIYTSYTDIGTVSTAHQTMYNFTICNDRKIFR